MKKGKLIINVDFDGTCVTHDFPQIGKEIGAAEVLKKLTDNGHKLILFTMRSKDNYIDEAVQWFKDRDIPLYGVNTNPTQHEWTKSPKSHAHMIIDDIAYGCPLTYNLSLSDRLFVDWKEVEAGLTKRGLINLAE